MVPNLVSDFVSELAPDREGDSGGCCGAGGELCAQFAALDSTNKRTNTIGRRLWRIRTCCDRRKLPRLRWVGPFDFAQGKAREDARPPHEQSLPKFTLLNHETLRVR